MGAVAVVELSLLEDPGEDVGQHLVEQREGLVGLGGGAGLDGVEVVVDGVVDVGGQAQQLLGRRAGGGGQGREREQGRGGGRDGRGGRRGGRRRGGGGVLSAAVGGAAAVGVAVLRLAAAPAGGGGEFSVARQAVRDVRRAHLIGDHVIRLGGGSGHRDAAGRHS